MAFLYLNLHSSELDAHNSIRDAFADRARRIETGRDLPVFCILSATHDDIAVAVELLFKQMVRSVAYLEKELPFDQYWIVSEWKDAVVASSSLKSSLDLYLDQFGSVEPFSTEELIIFKLKDKAAHQRELDKKRGPIVPVSEVLENPGRFYSKEALSEYGGANALFAAGREAAKVRGHDGVCIYSKEDLGYSRAPRENSIVHWVESEVIRAHCIGFSRMHRQVEELFQKFDLDLTQDVFSDQLNSFERYQTNMGVAIVLQGLQDPPVTIPVGSVFQQPKMNSPMQALGTAHSVTVTVAANAVVPVILPAFCLNQSLAPPDGPILPTTLVNHDIADTQQSVWAQIRDRAERTT